MNVTASMRLPSGVADEGRVIIVVIFRPQSRRPIRRAAGVERGRVERVDGSAVGRAQANMHAAVVGDMVQRCALVDPEFQIFLAITDRRVRPLAQFDHAERGEQHGVERLRPAKIAHRDGNVIDHVLRLLLKPARRISPVCRRWNPSAPGTTRR
jgi:hypothetical protein